MRTITGADEGLYGWVALNYVMNRLGHRNVPTNSQHMSDEGPQTLGALDLGGSSLEVTYVPSDAGEAMRMPLIASLRCNESGYWFGQPTCPTTPKQRPLQNLMLLKVAAHNTN